MLFTPVTPIYLDTKKVAPRVTSRSTLPLPWCNWPICQNTDVFPILRMYLSLSRTPVHTWTPSCPARPATSSTLASDQPSKPSIHSWISDPWNDCFLAFVTLNLFLIFNNWKFLRPHPYTYSSLSPRTTWFLLFWPPPKFRPLSSARQKVL